MNQDYIVFAIISLTISYIIYSFVKSMRVKKTSQGCGGCSGCEISKNNISCNVLK